MGCALFFATIASFGEEKPQSETDAILETGIKYFMRGDYQSAEAMLKNIKEKTPVQYAIAAYYLGSIEANSGDKEKAYKYFCEAIKTAPAEVRTLAATQLAKLADENGDFKKIYEMLYAQKKDFETSPLLDFYFAKAFLAKPDSSFAKKDFEKKLAAEMQKEESIFADMFVSDKLAEEELFKNTDLSGVKNSEPAARARLSILKNPKEILAKELVNSGFYAQIYSSEKRAEGVDFTLLEKRLSKYKDSPLAWRAALAVAENDFKEKKYKRAAEFAAFAELLAPPDMNLSYPAIMLLGDCNRLMKNYDLAREDYLKIAMNKNLRGTPLAESLYKLGVCWYEQKQWGKAHPYFERVYILYFKLDSEYWGGLAYYYDASTLLMMNQRRDAAATLLEYFKRAKNKDSQMYKDAKLLYNEQYGSSLR